MRFPSVVGANLSGKKYRLPEDFEGELNLVQLAYLQDQQSNIDTWGPLLAILARRHPSLRYYELPTIRPLGWFQQLIVDNGMRMGIPSKAVRDRTITLYLDVAAFNAALGITDINTIYTMLLGRDGSVLWRATGDYTLDKGDELARLLADLGAARIAA